MQALIQTLFPISIGAVVALGVRKYVFKLNSKEKQIDRILEKRLEAYENLYRLALESAQMKFDDLINAVHELSHNFDLYSTEDSASALLKFLVAHGEHEKNSTDENADILVGELNALRRVLQKELGIKLASPETLRKIWGLKKD